MCTGENNHLQTCECICISRVVSRRQQNTQRSRRREKKTRWHLLEVWNSKWEEWQTCFFSLVACAHSHTHIHTTHISTSHLLSTTFICSCPPYGHRQKINQQNMYTTFILDVNDEARDGLGILFSVLLQHLYIYIYWTPKMVWMVQFQGCWSVSTHIHANTCQWRGEGGGGGGKKEGNIQTCSIAKCYEMLPRWPADICI